jgi:hypothetical protein
VDSVNPEDSMSFIALADSEKIAYQFNIFLDNFRNLIVEILNFIQITSWNHLNPDKGDLTIMNFDYPRLMEWFIKQVFNPKNGLPLMGRTQLQIAEDLKFNPVQMEIIKLLENSQYVKKASQKITTIWHTNHLNKRKDYSCKKVLDLEGSSAEDGSPKNNAGIFVHPGRYLDMGDFRMYDIQKLTENRIQIRGKNLLTWIRQIPKLSKAPGSTNNQYLCIHSKLKKIVEESTFHKDFPVKDKNIGFFIHDHHYSPFQALVILVDEHSRTALKRSQIKERLRLLLPTLEEYFIHIFSHLSLTSKSTFPDDFLSQNLKQFLEWIFQAFSSSPHSSNFKIPIIGTFQKSVAGSHTKYHPVQLSIMRAMLTRSWCKYQENAMALVGYWLKHFQKAIWNQKFGNDQEYSLFLYRMMVLQENA